MTEKKTTLVKKATKRIATDNEIGARKNLLEELFNDFHKSRRQVYFMNLFRGIFFGFGSVLGATIVVAIVVWLLGQFGDIFPPLADFLNNLIESMQRRR